MSFSLLQVHLYLVIADRIRTGDPRGLYKGRSLKFRVGSRVRLTLEEGQMTYQPKWCGNNNMSFSLLQVHLYPVIADRIRTGDPSGFNKGRSLKFHVGSRVRLTLEEGRMTYQPKRCGNNNKDEDNSPKTLNDKKKPKLILKTKQMRLEEERLNRY